MRKTVKLIAVVLIAASAAYAQVPCPVMLVSGSSEQDSITLSFRNKGKLPIEQLRLSCKPSPQSRSASGICAAESGVFYPSMQYSIHLAFPKLASRSVVVSVAEVVMSSGAHWDVQSADKCRSLRVARKG